MDDNDRQHEVNVSYRYLFDHTAIKDFCQIGTLTICRIRDPYCLLIPGWYVMYPTPMGGRIGGPFKTKRAALAYGE